MSYQPYTISDAVGGGVILSHNGYEVGTFESPVAAAEAAARDAIAAGTEAASDFVVEAAAEDGLTLEAALEDPAFQEILAAAFMLDWAEGARPSPR